MSFSKERQRFIFFGLLPSWLVIGVFMIGPILIMAVVSLLEANSYGGVYPIFSLEAYQQILFDYNLFDELEFNPDLYAAGPETFRKITLPLLTQGSISGLMLALVISLDDFIITLMVAGAGSTTLPVYIYSMIRQGLTPEVNAVSTLMLLVSVLMKI